MGGKNPGKGECGIAFIEYVESEMMCKALDDAVSGLCEANAQLELALVTEQHKGTTTAVRAFMDRSVSNLSNAITALDTFKEFVRINAKELTNVESGVIPSDSFDYGYFGSVVVNQEGILDEASYSKVAELLASRGFLGFFTHLEGEVGKAREALERAFKTFDLARGCIIERGGISLASHDNRIPIRQDYTRAFTRVLRLSLDWAAFALVSTEMHLTLCDLPGIAPKRSIAV